MGANASGTSVIVSVATNGYDRIYADCVRSHRRYAEQHGYRYVLAGESPERIGKADAAWLKLDLVARALDDGAEWVMLVDSDARFTASTPRFESVEEIDADVYAALGHSGRINSGVLIWRNTGQSRNVLEQIISSRGTAVSEGTWNGWVDWGENGHVIHHLASHDGLATIGPEWNNTISREIPHHVRHFTGPMRSRGVMKVYRRLLREIMKRRTAKRVSLDVLIPDEAERMRHLVDRTFSQTAASSR